MLFGKKFVEPLSVAKRRGVVVVLSEEGGRKLAASAQNCSSNHSRVRKGEAGVLEKEVRW